MYQNNILESFLMLKLAYGLEKRLTLNISDGSAHFYDSNLCFGSSRIAVKSAFNFICDVGNDLYGSSAEITPALFLQDRPVNLSRCDI